MEEAGVSGGWTGVLGDSKHIVIRLHPAKYGVDHYDPLRRVPRSTGASTQTLRPCAAQQFLFLRTDAVQRSTTYIEFFPSSVARQIIHHRPRSIQ